MNLHFFDIHLLLTLSGSAYSSNFGNSKIDQVGLL